MDRKSQAITYINNNKNKLDLNKIVEYIATNFNYSEKYARYIYFNNQKESNSKSLRESDLAEDIFKEITGHLIEQDYIKKTKLKDLKKFKVNYTKGLATKFAPLKYGADAFKLCINKILVISRVITNKLVQQLRHK